MRNFNLGIDLSSWEGRPVANINWDVAKSRGVDMYSIRATYFDYNKDVVDAGYIQNVENAHARGAAVAHYCYYKHSSSSYGDPVRQADFFIRTVAPYLQEGDGLWLDFEDGSNNTPWVGEHVRVLTWLDIVKYTFGEIPAVYTRPNLITAYLYNAYLRPKPTRLCEFPLAIAHWRTSAPYITLPWLPGDEFCWQTCGDEADAIYYGFPVGSGTLGLSMYTQKHRGRNG